MRQLYAYDANESTRRLRVKDGMSTGLTNMHAHGSWILCSVSRHKGYLTLPYVVLRRIEIHSALERSWRSVALLRLFLFSFFFKGIEKV